MNENPNMNTGIPEEPAGNGQGTSGTQGTPNQGADWQEVGRQFQVLGQSIADAMRTAWQNEETQRQLREMRMGLESMVKDVGKAIEDSANTPQGQKIRQDAGKAAEKVRVVGEQTVQEVRPKLIDALKQLNDELQKLIARMEKKEEPKNQA